MSDTVTWASLGLHHEAPAQWVRTDPAIVAAKLHRSDDHTCRDGCRGDAVWRVWVEGRLVAPGVTESEALAVTAKAMAA